MANRATKIYTFRKDAGLWYWFDLATGRESKDIEAWTVKENVTSAQNNVAVYALNLREVGDKFDGMFDTALKKEEWQATLIGSRLDKATFKQANQFNLKKAISRLQADTQQYVKICDANFNVMLNGKETVIRPDRIRDFVIEQKA